MLTKRTFHRYGDHVEYRCNIGYGPQRIIRFCGLNGQWSGDVLKCEGKVWLLYLTFIFEGTETYFSVTINCGGHEKFVVLSTQTNDLDSLIK